MKKILVSAILFLGLACGFVYADHPSGLGIGIQGGVSGAAGAGDFGGDLTLKLPTIPLFWTIGAVPYAGYTGLTVAGDYYLLDQNIIPMLGWYVGLGAGVHLGVGGDSMNLAIAGRIPVGITFQPAGLLEIYLQIVPQLGLAVLPNLAMWDNFWGGNIGIRLWF
jgi:hypothetical protein